MTRKHKKKPQDKVKQMKILAGFIAHEMRHPLASSIQTCQLMQFYLNKIIEYNNSMVEAQTRGIAISDLILNNINSGEVDKSKFIKLSIFDVVSKALKQYPYKDDKEKDRVDVDLTADFSFKGDENMMIFVIFNLLKNALYYQSNIKIKSEIKLDGQSEGKSAGKYLYFKDDGPGIPSNKLELIFESFFTSGKKTGIGLGLPFCKTLPDMLYDALDTVLQTEIGKTYDVWAITALSDMV